MSKTFVIGDIHGAHKPLEQCLKRCGFNKETDTLITLGDICDGWPYVWECVDILRQLNTVNVIGNHDEWFHRWLKTGRHPDNWYQGGKGTYSSYFRAARRKEMDSLFDTWERDEDGTPIRHLPGLLVDEIPDEHKQFFESQLWYYKDNKNRLFVHGGFLKEYTLEENMARYQDDYYFHWNRLLWDQALACHDGDSLEFAEEFSEIFIGHTETTNWTRFKRAPGSYVLIPNASNDCPPMHADIIWNLDTGAGSTGKLTIMDVDTHEYWQSDLVNTFYGDYKPR